MTELSDVSLPCERVSDPLLKDTVDKLQKTFNCTTRDTVLKWRAALALRYLPANVDTHSDYTTEWTDVDCNEGALSLPPLQFVPLDSPLWKTTIRVFKYTDKKCITVTLYVYKKATRKKGAGSCLIQGILCSKWARQEFTLLCRIVQQLTVARSDIKHALPLADHTPSCAPIVELPEEDSIISDDTQHSEAPGVDSSIPNMPAISEAMEDSSTKACPVLLGTCDTASTTEPPNTADAAVGTESTALVTVATQATDPTDSRPTCTCSQTLSDLKVQIANLLRVQTQCLNDRLDSLQTENATLTQTVSELRTELRKKIDSIDGRQREILKHTQSQTNQVTYHSAISVTGEGTEDKRQTDSKVTTTDNRQMQETMTDSRKRQETLDAGLDGVTHQGMSQQQRDAELDRVDPDLHMSAKFHIVFPRREHVTNFIIGDSNVKGIQRVRLDRSGQTHIRTMPGATIQDVTQSLQVCSTQPNIQRVVVHIGGNDTYRHTTQEQMRPSYERLCDQLQRVFPCASIALTAILPRKRVPISVTHALNKALSDICNKRKLCFLSDASFLESDCETPSWYLFSGDRVHLNSKGLAVWLRSVKSFLDLNKHNPENVHFSNTKQTPPKQIDVITTDRFTLTPPPLTDNHQWPPLEVPHRQRRSRLPLPQLSEGRGINQRSPPTPDWHDNPPLTITAPPAVSGQGSMTESHYVGQPVRQTGMPYQCNTTSGASPLMPSASLPTRNSGFYSHYYRPNANQAPYPLPPSMWNVFQYPPNPMYREMYRPYNHQPFYTNGLG